MIWNRTRMLLTAVTLVILAATACAHRRESFYSSDFGSGRGVQVRAPFVDVRVRGRNQEPSYRPDLADREAKVSRKHDDDEDDRD